MTSRGKPSILRLYWRFLSKALLRWGVLATCLVGAVVLFGAVNARVLLHHAPAHQPEVLAGATLVRQKLPAAMDQHARPLGVATGAVFWGVVGVSAYSLGWLVRGLSVIVRPRSRARWQVAATYSMLGAHGLSACLLGYALYRFLIPAVGWPVGAPLPDVRHAVLLWAAGCVGVLTLYLYAVATTVGMFWRTVRFVDAAARAQRQAKAGRHSRRPVGRPRAR